jgi:hypothetical protein
MLPLGYSSVKRELEGGTVGARVRGTIARSGGVLISLILSHAPVSSIALGRVQLVGSSLLGNE